MDWYQFVSEAPSGAPDQLPSWREKLSSALRDELEAVVLTGMLEFVNELNLKGHHVKRFPGPQRDPFGFADYESSGDGSVRLWITANLVITNMLLEDENREP